MCNHQKRKKNLNVYLEDVTWSWSDTETIKYCSEMIFGFAKMESGEYSDSQCIKAIISSFMAVQKERVNAEFWEYKLKDTETTNKQRKKSRKKQPIFSLPLGGLRQGAARIENVTLDGGIYLTKDGFVVDDYSDVDEQKVMNKLIQQLSL